MFDYELIKFTMRNPDTIQQLVCKGIKSARNNVSKLTNIEITDTLVMILATAHILMRLGIVTDSDYKAIIRWFRTEATSRSTMSDTICYEFKTAVSNAILSGELKIAKQIGPPYYSPNGYTAFIAEKDKSINMDDDVVYNVLIPNLHTRSVTKINKHINEKGWLKGKHTNKRKLKVAYADGIFEDNKVIVV